jgi:UDP-N-acetylmuramoyl-L-alanyl-D-glutamate--2,6-diaminopimelate ligase
MTLDELVRPLEPGLEVVERNGNQQVVITDVTDDSRAVIPGALFVAVKGERVDGHEYLQAAIRQQAGAVVVQRGGGAEVPTVLVKNSRRALGLLGSGFHGNPSAKLRVIGITGTNGKTTTTYICKSLLESRGTPMGLVGTVAYVVGKEIVPASHTTPGAVELQRLFGRMVKAELAGVVMEVSSHALALDRTAGVEFDVAVFTNLTQDHLDFHGTMEEYFRAKVRLFSDLSPEGRKTGTKRAIINTDDPRGEAVRAACSVPVWTYGIHNKADLRAEALRLTTQGTVFTLKAPVGSVEIESQLVGEHNVYNLLAAIGVALHEGMDLDQIRASIGTVTHVPGRFERVEAGQDFTVVVDYAHTDDALTRLLTAAQALRTGRIITVFGCGGDRDRTKRPKMGRVAVRFSDVVVLTSDNPRTEDPNSILAEVEVGVQDALTQRPDVVYALVPDRRLAIERAIREARPGDMVLIAGKGHEDYQIIGTTKFHFDDREVAREAVLKLSSGPA